MILSAIRCPSPLKVGSSASSFSLSPQKNGTLSWPDNFLIQVSEFVL